MLHIVNTLSAFKQCAQFLSELNETQLKNHEILLLDPSVCLSPKDKPSGLSIYTLTDDYDEFVSLVLKHEKTLTWP